MTKAKQTQGPWEYVNGWLYHRGISPTGSGYSETILKIDEPAWQPSKVDAALIKAAPEMLTTLEAVERLLAGIEATDYPVSDELAQVRATIAKARLS